MLIEAGDFASATSSRSTKLIHGGIRYLQEAVTDLDPGQYNVVKRALHERRIMLDNARFLAHPDEFLVPCYTWWEAFYYGVGTKIYDRIAGKQNFFASGFRSAHEAVVRWPLLQGEGLERRHRIRAMGNLTTLATASRWCRHLPKRAARR